jgi:drug/metabolite transporter (DMT)-like permease
MSWISLLYSIVFVTIYGLVIWYAGIGRIGVTSSMVYMYLVPVIAMLIASIILKERISSEQGIGTLIIFVGLWLIKKS